MHPRRIPRRMLEDDPEPKETLRRRNLVGELDTFIRQSSPRHLGNDCGVEHRWRGRKRIDDRQGRFGKFRPPFKDRSQDGGSFESVRVSKNPLHFNREVGVDPSSLQSLLVRFVSSRKRRRISTFGRNGDPSWCSTFSLRPRPSPRSVRRDNQFTWGCKYLFKLKWKLCT